MVAISHTIYPALELFRYRSASDYYDTTAFDGTSDGTNYWKLYNLITMYGMMSIGGILTLTQLLSMFGVAAQINVILWGYAGMLVGPILGAFISGMAMWGYD